ncbi:MAG: hypothetical protein IJC41_06995 [Firmicutes bacterium]|nr:hypothetical protein [Clostridiales bacterium]MBQ4340727.1 hypothetical protein [Bacillota bacterium]
MISRDTCPMPPLITDNKSRSIGVIGTEQGAGASFICELLERELKAGKCFALHQDKSGFNIVDMGEYKKEQDKPAPESLIIVVDGSSCSDDKLITALKIMKDQGKILAVIFNKCSSDFVQSEDPHGIYEGIPCFMIPMIQTNRFTELYNFIFYS